MRPPEHRVLVLTPPGAGAIAIIKLIGPNPIAILEGTLNRSIVQHSTACGKLSYRRFMDGGEVLDDVLVSIERLAENQRAVEISCHGGIRVVQRIIELCERRGAKVEAEPSAALTHWPASNKIEEDAIAALAGAKTQRAARYASRLRTELPAQIRNMRALWDSDPTQARLALAEALSGYEPASALLRGITVPMIGPPNSGKSTLFNALLGREAVVTSPIAGTTRDWVMETVEFQGVPVNLVDTAGRHRSDCELEQLAIQAGDAVLHKSSAVLLVFDGSRPLPESAAALLKATSRKPWVVANKADLGFCWLQRDCEFIKRESGSDPLRVSALTLAGCEMLQKAILEHFGLLSPVEPPPAFFTKRHLSLAGELSNPARDPRQILAALLGDALAEPEGKGL